MTACSPQPPRLLRLLVLPLAPASAPPLLDVDFGGGGNGGGDAGLEKLARSLLMVQRELAGGASASAGTGDERPRRALLAVGAAPGAALLEAALLARGRVLVVALSDAPPAADPVHARLDDADAAVEAVAAAADAALAADADVAEACAPLVLRMRGEEGGACAEA